MFCVGDRNTEQNRRQHCDSQSSDGQAEMEIGDQPHQPDQQLHNRVLNGDSLAAIAAAAAQKQPAQNGDVLGGLDLMTALGAPGSRLYYAQAVRPAADADIEERSY